MEGLRCKPVTVVGLPVEAVWRGETKQIEVENNGQQSRSFKKIEIAPVGLEKGSVQLTIEGFAVFMGKEIIEIAHVGLEKVGEKFNVTVSMKKLRIGKQENRRGKSLVVQKQKIVVVDRPICDGIATIDLQSKGSAAVRRVVCALVGDTAHKARLRRLLIGGVLHIV